MGIRDSGLGIRGFGARGFDSVVGSGFSRPEAADGGGLDGQGSKKVGRECGFPPQVAILGEVEG
jgi:hypothetical protein